MFGRLGGGAGGQGVVEGVRLALSNDWKNVIVESDSAIVIDHLLGRNFAWRVESELSNALVLASSVESIRWVKIPRAANLCANWIAS